MHSKLGNLCVGFAVSLAFCCLIFGQAKADLKESPCAVAIPANVTAKCYILSVPENRSVSNSRSISLPVVVIKSTATTPQADPVIYTAGGPGAGSLNMVRGAGNLVPYTAERDFIVFEQRGTKDADPSLTCPEVTEAIHASFGTAKDPRNEVDAEVKAAKACRQRLTKLGIDLSAYNSKESAADLDDLRRLLGVEKWNLYGISYSTRLMVTYARSYPQQVRSLILDSVLPITANWDETGVENIMAAIKRIFAACAAQRECSERYPDLERSFYSTVETLDREPAKVDVTIDGQPKTLYLYGRHFVDLIYNLAEGNGSLQWTPWTVNAVNKKDLEPLKKYADEQLKSPGFIWGMRYSVWCGEEMPFESKSKITMSGSPKNRLGGFVVQQAMPGICKVWNIAAANKIENEAVKLNVPVLSFGGEFDPDTPFSWAEQVAGWSDRGYFFKVPSTTHGTMNRKCTFVDIPVAFLKDPTSMPDGSCLKSIPPIVFK